MTLTITLDWIAFTFKEHTHAKKTWLATHTNPKTSVPITAHNGYASALREANEIVHMWNDDRSEMGHHVIINGTALRNIVEQGVYTQQELLKTIVDAGSSVTRLDLAKDAQNVAVDYADIWNDLERRNYTGNAQKTAILRGNDGGVTIYVGSRTSERFIRLYDKAAQTGSTGILWARLELETKGMVSRGLATLLTSQNDWSSIFNTQIASMVNLPQPSTINVFLSDTSCKIGVPKLAKVSDTEAWIETQVISAVAKHYIEHPDSVAIQRLRDMINLLDEQSRRSEASETE